MNNLQTTDIRVLHIAAHLGGGVGKVLSELVRPTKKNKNIKHSFVLTDQPQNNYFINKIQSYGYDVKITTSPDEIESMTADFDILQIEWWNNPSLLKLLNSINIINIQTIAWAHYLGKKSPIIPNSLFNIIDQLIVSSSISLSIPSLINFYDKGKVSYISSSCGAEYMSKPNKIFLDTENIRYGYVGSCHPTKIFSGIADWLFEVERHFPNFKLNMWGDSNGIEIILTNADKLTNRQLFIHHGHNDNIDNVYNNIDVMIYLLESNHYGTGENVIIEAMAKEILVIVLNNEVESTFIENGITGFVISSVKDLLNCIDFIQKNPVEVQKIQKRARKKSLTQYSSARLQIEFNSKYYELKTQKKKTKFFNNFLGKTPADWYISFLDNQDRITLAEKITNNKIDILKTSTKGSILHYQNYFASKDFIAEIQDTNFLNKFSKE